MYQYAMDRNAVQFAVDRLGVEALLINARLFHCIETLDKMATPLDTKIVHSNGPNYDGLISSPDHYDVTIIAVNS